jgi:multidrug efflux system membrane fusion protein
MKKSIYLASAILLITIGWLASGQIGNVNAQDESIKVEKDAKLLNKEEDKSSDNSNNGKNANIIKVETKIFNVQQIDQSIVIQGQTIYNKKIDVKSETTGNITNINFDRGDNVIQNKKLLNISIENRKEVLTSVERDLSRLKKEVIINEKNRDNLLSKNSELIKLYEIEYLSAKQLIDKGLSSKSKLSLASFNLVNSKSDQIDINLQYEKQLANLESQIASYNSQLKQINLDIEKTKILSPFDGIITDKNIEISDYVTPGMILLTIVNLNPIKVQGYLSEFDVNKIQLNTKALIENTNGIKKNGKITFISPSAETSTRTFEIEIEADNSDLTFKSGITTSIVIEGSELLAHKIPPSILTLQDDGTIGVKALSDENMVIFFPIQKVKDTVDGMWVSGLPNEVNLIISGQEYVSTGQIIELK